MSIVKLNLGDGRQARMTDLASLKFREEATLLGRSMDPDATYRSYLLPEKVSLAKQYARGCSLKGDVALILNIVSTHWRASPLPGIPDEWTVYSW
jgi:hypothetical protein